MSAPVQSEHPHGLSVNLPALPSFIRYYDDFSDVQRVIAQPEETDTWRLEFDGRVRCIDFSCFEVCVRDVAKNWTAFNLARFAPSTALLYVEALAWLPASSVVRLLSCSPEKARSLWNSLRAEGLERHEFRSIKSFLYYLCALSIGAWKPCWTDMLSRLRIPGVDRYAAVRAGNVFLSADEEAAIVRSLDDFASQALEGSALYDCLELGAVLVCSFQFGMRSKQIAMLRFRDIRTWQDGLEPTPAVHLTFRMIKQRYSQKALPLVRRVKREWCPIFVSLLKNKKGVEPDRRVFPYTPNEITRLVADFTERLGGIRRTPGDLRHTRTQRLVDAGATQEEVAAFMGHTNLDTLLVYFRESAAQAELVNRALGDRSRSLCDERRVSAPQGRSAGRRRAAWNPHHRYWRMLSRPKDLSL